MCLCIAYSASAGNCNAPRAVTYSALIYCLRCLVNEEIPLNQGCLDPITVDIPKNSILDPSPTAAVVGGMSLEFFISSLLLFGYDSLHFC